MINYLLENIIGFCICCFQKFLERTFGTEQLSGVDTGCAGGITGAATGVDTGSGFISSDETMLNVTEPKANIAPSAPYCVFAVAVTV